MTKHTPDAREQQQHREAEKALEEVGRNRQNAEQEEVAGRHNNDGVKDHQGADKGPRGQ
ncbi:MAG: hypothetical protein JWR40_2184 [Massilia sp.]|jgi:hypothetical protein|nr:hypothetical protein [Massilia sp.]MDB5949917.1 hypothetical protein [Massilia sp.]